MRPYLTNCALRSLALAANLISEDGENVEYDRAILELTADLLGVDAIERGALMAILLAVKTG